MRPLVFGLSEVRLSRGFGAEAVGSPMTLSTASPFSDRLLRTRKALSAQITSRILPIYTPIIHPRLKKLLGDVLDISQGPAVDMADRLHHFCTGQVSEQLMGQAFDDATVATAAENETDICWCPVHSILMSCGTLETHPLS